MTCRPPSIGHARPELNVGAAAGHVGGDGHRAALAGARDDLGFLLVILRVQDGVDDSRLLQHARQAIRSLRRRPCRPGSGGLAVNVRESP